MEEFPIVIIAIILSIISAVNKNKKKQTAAARRQLAQERNAAAEVKTPKEPPVAQKPAAVPAMSVWHDEPKPAASHAPVMGAEGTDSCHDYMLPRVEKKPVKKSLENHRPAAPAMGMEGVDPCHEFMLDDPAAPRTETLDDSGISPEEAQELVRGIIISEIMARPQTRFAGRAR